VPLFYQASALRAHRGIFLDAVTFWHNDGAGGIEATTGCGDGLSMIASRRGDHAAFLAPCRAITDIDQAATNFEGTDGGMIFVLYP